jgi:Sec-independent protein translocase protein TatA
MSTGIGFSEILLILAIIVIFIDSKQIPGLIRNSIKIMGQVRAAIKKFIDELDVK